MESNRMRSPIPLISMLLALTVALAASAALADRPTAAVRAMLSRAPSEPADQALRTLAEAAALAEQRGDKAGSLAVAAVAQTLGRRTYERGDLAAARRLFQAALAIREKLTPNPLLLAASLNGLGIVACSQGDFGAAKSYHERALAIQESQASDSLDVGVSLNNLGLVAAYQSNFTTAEALFLQAQVIQEKRAPESRNLAGILNNRGLIAQMHRGDLEAARALFEHALKIQQKRARGSVDVAGTLHNLGYAARAQGDLEAAQGFFEQALRIQKQQIPGSLAVAGSLKNLAALLDERGDRARALALLREARAILDRQAPHAPITAAVLRQLAQLLLDGGPSAEAGADLQQAEQIEETVKSLPWGPVPAAETDTPVTRPEVRFRAPSENEEVFGDEVKLHVELLSPLPLARYRVWINGRPLGGEQGFSESTSVPKGIILEKGCILEKGVILEKGADREALAQEVPPEVGALARTLQYSHYQQHLLTLPVEDTDGAFLRIAVAAETNGGSVSDRQILRLRRPAAEASRGALRVLAIGVGAYAHLLRLRFAAADARDLAAALQAQAGDGKLYRSAAVKVLTDADATLPALREALAWLTRDVQKGETLMLMLSGHGVKAGAGYYFAPADLDPANTSGTGLPWKEVLTQLETARPQARAIWVLADCCRAAPQLAREEQATSADLRRGVEEGGNLVICTASADDQPSYEDSDLKHGLFTQAWLEALRGEAGKKYQVAYKQTARGWVLTFAGLQLIVSTKVDEFAGHIGKRQEVVFPPGVGTFPSNLPLFVPLTAPNR